MKVFIIGINGFIGSHLLESILRKTDWTVTGIDLESHRIDPHLDNPRLDFQKGDFTALKDYVSAQIADCDVVLPLAAIATPKTYVTSPLSVFELDFEANLWIIRQCAAFRTRIVFPSTSEVYGMCKEDVFLEESSELVLGPIHKTRWIYSCSKQLLDRIIWSYGNEGLEFTIFRPFNWIGSNQDNIHGKEGCSRVISQFIGNILREEPINLVDGGAQKRTFLDISDGVNALVMIIQNREASRNQIFNVGNPDNEYSIRELAGMLVEKMQPYLERSLVFEDIVQDTSASNYYGNGYQDVDKRVPSIEKISQALQWHPSMTLEQSVEKIVAFYLPAFNQITC